MGTYVEVDEVLPYGMFDTVIRFVGRDANDTEVLFAVDHRPARSIIEMLAHSNATPVVELERWQILSTVDHTVEPSQSQSEREADRAAGRE